MELPMLPSRFLARLGVPADAAERRRIERVLASARVFLAYAGLLAILLDPTEPTRYAGLAYSLLIAYALYSVVVWQWLNRLEEFKPSFPWIHAFDVVFPTVFTLFTEGPNSPFFLYFVFVLTAAAFRWGFLETLGTAVTIVLLMAAQALLLTFGHAYVGTWLIGEYDLNRLVIRISYLVILGVLLGYLAEEEKQLRSESTFIAGVIGQARVELGLRGSMQRILGELLRLCRSERALVLLEQVSTNRLFLWHSERLGNGNSIGYAEVAAEQRATYSQPIPLHSFYAERGGQGESWTIWALDAESRRARALPGWSPSSCPELRTARSVLSISFAMGEEWTGRLLLFDVTTGLEKFQELRFTQKLLRQIAPAIYNVYLLRRLRSRAGAIERARVARELHDGAIQALIAVEMQVDVLRRQAGQPAAVPSVPSQLQRIQDMLREQVFNLRTLMQQLRTVELSPAQLLDYLSDVVERFRHDTGISARFVSGLDEVDLAPRVCRELVRILQEALVNVRKHSGAANVLVRLAMYDGACRLTVEDDGRGLSFSGRMSLAEMDAKHQGPIVLKERVRVLGGDLQIESQPGQGCRLEITLPQKAQVAYV